MDDRAFETLELKNLVELAALYVQTAPGRTRMMHLRPSTFHSEILESLNLTSECVTFLNTRGGFGLSGVEDPEPIVAQLHIAGTSLEPRQILALQRLLLVARDVRDLIRSTETKDLFPHLLRIAAQIPDLRHVLAGIQGKILPNGEIDDNASPELRILRRDLTERRSRIHRTLEAVIRGQGQAVQDEIITFRNGRFVIPVRTDSRGQIPGVVHGLSSSGQTTFVEPLTIINQNNDLVRLREQEEMEVSRILSLITESLRENIDSIKSMIEILTELDVAQAKARLAIEFQCSVPRISQDKTCILKDARHILLEHSLRSSGGKSVPISLELDENHQVLVISGPNAGGKTVVLKTLGLLSLMAQMGFHLPAREVLIPVFDQIFADIGDQQSIAANLSTFTAHMRNIAEAARRVQPPALVLLDEVGTGTDPDEGAALSIAIVDYFRKTGATTVASTHYPALKMWASQAAGVRNAAVEFDERTLRPTYRLIMGIAGASSGLEIAKRMQVEESILTHARELVEPSHAQAREYLKRLKETLDNHDRQRAALEEERAALAEKWSKLDLEFARREEARRVEFDAALAKVVAEFKAEGERSIRKIKDRVEAARLKKTVENQAAELRRQSARLHKGAGQPGTLTASSSKSEEIQEGDRVRIESLDREGIVESIRDDSYVVMIGPLRYRADRQDLVRMPGQASPVRVPSVSASILDISEEIGTELKVIGLSADEALDRVDKFLDQAFLADIETVRIIHGHGKGILRSAISEKLTSHPQVESFSLAPHDKGGAGATIVVLKK
jgi:DNA mismatch repair protein MutS2